MELKVKVIPIIQTYNTKHGGVVIYVFSMRINISVN